MIYLSILFVLSMVWFALQLARAYRFAGRIRTGGANHEGPTYRRAPEWWLTAEVMSAAIAVVAIFLLLVGFVLIEDAKTATRSLVDAESSQRIARDEGLLRLIEGQQSIIEEQNRRLRALEIPPRPSPAQRLGA